MKIHGTAKGGAIGKKDFGVAFSATAPAPEIETLDTGGTSDWVAKFDLKGNTYADSGGSVMGIITSVESPSDSPWQGKGIGFAIGHNGAGWTGDLMYSYGGLDDPNLAGSCYTGGDTAYKYFLLAQSGTTVTGKVYPSDTDRTNDTNQIGSTVTMSSFVEMTDLKYASFGDNRTTNHTFNGQGDNFSVVQTGNIDWSDDFSDASKWDITDNQPTINDAVSNQGSIIYTKGDTTYQYWARQGLTGS